MKVAILAGGYGSRLSEETANKPKPMVEIGGKPILWHIMKTYAYYGFNEFVIALGYKGDIIKDYFINYYYRESNLVVDLRSGDVKITEMNAEKWIVHLLETGVDTQTGGRVKRLAEYIHNEPFLLTYGDGVANVNISDLIAFHRSQGRIATVTAVRPPARFGAVQFNGDRVKSFQEKPQVGEGWINGGFFVLEPEIVHYIQGDPTVFEKEPMEKLAQEDQLVAYRHYDFWHMMDTLRDLKALEKMWAEQDAPWKVW